MIPPHALAERALQAAGRLDGAIAIVRTSSRADLRWARTTLTTNGESRRTELTLIGFGTSSGSRPAESLDSTHPTVAASGRTAMATATLTVVQPDAQDIEDLFLAECVAHFVELVEQPAVDSTLTGFVGNKIP